MGYDDMSVDSEEDFVDLLDEESDFDFEDEENINPNKKKASKKKPAAKSTTKKKTAKTTTTKRATKKKVTKEIEIENEEEDDDYDLESMDIASPAKGNGKTVEQIYQKKTQLEHILLRPDTYIGGVEPNVQQMYVLDQVSKSIVSREITYTPGLFKIFDEIVVNAADNKQRDPKMDKMEIVIDAEKNEISVKNTGKGIPVVHHKEHNCYVPTLIFGHLLSGSNFDDDEKKTTGGRNGYGAKLANIFSTRFCVECVDTKSGQKFSQVFTNNMHEMHDPVIKKLTPSEKKKGDSTKITFSPDLARFKMTSLDSDTVSLLSRRAYDVAGSMASKPGKKMEVTLNGEKVPVKSFKDYVGLFEGINTPEAFEVINDRWEIGVGVSDGTFQQVSFVNAISTSKGGGHVDYVVSEVSKFLQTAVKKKNKDKTDIKVKQFKNHLSIFVNCLVENPTFDSQTKENLTTRAKVFEKECKLPEKFLKKLEKSGIVEAILAYASFKQKEQMKKKGGTKKQKLTGIAKLDDANFAGSAKSAECTLILTEGDSAKSLAMSGLSVVGRDYYGVFPLKGKPLNVREQNQLKVIQNEEIKSIVNILGLKFGVTYDETNIKSLRYGHLMIMADQDYDGSHIKGLVINFLHNFWPSLLNVQGFLQQFITPIVKVTKGKKTKTFFTVPQYKTWMENNDTRGFNIKYYKGLGTSTSAEAKEYFSNLDLHEITFSNMSDDVIEIEDESEIESEDEISLTAKKSKIVPDVPCSGNELIVMAFSGKKVDQRRKWLNNIEKGVFCDYSKAQDGGLRYSDFINKELILFSIADNQRSIPHLYDGFKPSMRKVLFSCIKRKLKGEIKVAQLAGYIGEHSAYHHGEASLHGTIVGMAQNFVGANNINLLHPSGQFGTRRMGGKDCSSARYIFTRLEPITRKIYHPDDDALLTYLEDDGLSIEPEYYMPVIPMILVNGAEGIGTGWSTKIPNYDPRQIISNIKKLINDEQMEEMHPYYEGFIGSIHRENSTKYAVKGNVERVDDTTILISELPIRSWTQDYKEFLEKLLLGDKDKGVEAVIKDFKENHTDTTVSFTVTAAKEQIDNMEKSKDGLHGKLKLTSNISTANMNLFDETSKIVKFSTPEEIVNTFFTVRLGYYFKRKEHLLNVMRRELRILSNKARFVEEVCNGDLIVNNRKRVELLLELQSRNYELFGNDDDKKNNEESSSSDEEEEEDLSIAKLSKGYDYLLGMRIWTLTYERAEQLRAQVKEKTAAVKELEQTPPSSIWVKDLDDIEDALDKMDAERQNALSEEKKAQQKSKNRKAKMPKKKATVRKQKKKDEWDTDMEESEKDDDYTHEFAEKAKTLVKRKTVQNTKKKPALRATPAQSTSSVTSRTSKKSTKSSNFNVSVEDIDQLSTQASRLTMSPEKSASSSLSPLSIAESDSLSVLTYTSDVKAKEVKTKSKLKTTKVINVDEESDISLVSKKPKATKKKNQAAEGKRKADEKEIEDIFEFDSISPSNASASSSSKRSRVNTSKVQVAGKKNRLQKKVITVDSSDDEKGFENNEASISPARPTTGRARSTRGRAKVNYVVESDESEDFIESEDFEDYDDENDGDAFSFGDDSE